MNIFVSDSDPIKSAMVLDDRRMNKMITESCQLLSTALILSGCPASELPIAKETGKPYRITHKNHPCAIWARQNRGNYLWLWQHMMGLLVEFSMRHGHEHWGDTNLPKLREAMKYIPEGERTPFPNCSLYKEEEDVYEAYRKTLVDKWNKDKPKPQWTRMARPWFYR